ncbi:MAG: protein kinase [Tepidisphaeraceae bacterium]
MELRCPYCRHTMVVQGVRPGRFTPRCSQCHEKFALLIPEGDAATPVVKPLPKPAADATVATRVHATAAPAAVTAPPKPAASSPPGATVPPVAGGVMPQLTASPQAAAAFAPPSPPEPAHFDSEKTAATRPPSAGIEPDPEPVTLGGYQIVQKLGQGGMGAVYMARQLSLDRSVAVKVLTPELAGDASFVSRFTREAYAAAQLVHHNIVQVYDIGEDKGRHYYSMEYVPGENLASLVQRNGKLDPANAVAYTLQAARGLKYAHDRGMIHRDVKPDNLLLSNEGIVKVADLGLVKRQGQEELKTGIGSKLAKVQSADVTGYNLSMGTPAYMSPEQARDAAHVDQRADIYSLGCTLYDLLTGRPPFSGKTAMEVMTKHANEPITPPDVLSKRVPKEVSAPLMKMVAKRPEDRYAHIDQCIEAMEDFLGTSSTGPFTPKEEHAAALETANKQFRDAPLAIVTRYTPLALFGVLLICAVGAAMFGETLGSRIVWVGTYIGVGVLTVAVYVVLAGLTWNHVVLKKLRPLIFGASIGGWVRTILLLAVGAMLLNVFGLMWAWASVALIAVALASGFLYGLQLLRDKQRESQLKGIDEMVRGMRTCAASTKTNSASSSVNTPATTGRSSTKPSSGTTPSSKPAASGASACVANRGRGSPRGATR